MGGNKIPIYKFTYFILLTFLQPSLFTQISVLDNLYNIFKIIAVIIILFLILRWNNYVSKLSIWMGIYWGSFIIATIINKGDISKSIRTVLSIYPLILYLDFAFRTNVKYTIRCIYKIFCVYFYINFIAQLFFNNGFGIYIPGYINGIDSRINFLGKDNSMLFFMIAFIIISFCYHIKNKKVIYFNSALVLTYMIIIWSGTGLVGSMILITCIILILNVPNFANILNFKILIPTYIIIYYLIIIARVQDIFSNLIVNVLQKDITFTGRTLLWDLAIEKIAKSPIWGVGITTEKYLIAKSGIAYSSHNMFLQMILNGGIVSLLLFLVIMFMFISAINKFNSKAIIGVFSIGVFCYLIGGLTEAVINDQYIYIIFVIGFNIKKIIQESEKIVRKHIVFR